MQPARSRSVNQIMYKNLQLNASFVKPPFHLSLERKTLAEVNDYRVADPKSLNGNLSTADGGCDETSRGRAAGHAGGRGASGTSASGLST